MTTTYQAEGRECINCGAEVEDFTGHWEASEMTACEECYEEVKENAPWSVEVIHEVPRKGDV